MTKHLDLPTVKAALHELADRGGTDWAKNAARDGAYAISALEFNRDALLEKGIALCNEKQRLAEALNAVLTQIRKAGVSNLANGVELGAMSWAIHMNDAMEFADAVLVEVGLAKADGRLNRE